MFDVLQAVSGEVGHLEEDEYPGRDVEQPVDPHGLADPDRVDARRTVNAMSRLVPHSVVAWALVPAPRTDSG